MPASARPTQHQKRDRCIRCARRFQSGYADSFGRSGGDSAVAPLIEVGVRKGGGSVHGNIYNAQVGLEYFPVRNVGVTDVDLQRDDYGLTRYRIKLQGPTLSLKARF